MATDSVTSWWRTAGVLCALAPAAGLLCPVAYAQSDGMIWERGDQSVFLAPQDEETAPPNDHPVAVAPEDIARMLADLSFRFADQGADTPPAAVFNREQVTILGEALAAGLTLAKPSQDITFSVVGAQRLSPGAFARRNRLTAGRVFFREGRLNLIFGEIQSPYRKKNIYGRTDQDFSPRRYGSRATAEEHESILIANAATRLHGDPEGERRDWVVFEPGNEADAASTRPMPAPAAPATVVTPEEAVRQPDASYDVEHRLQTLKRLREQDLISEEAYRQKVDEILDEL